MGPGAVPGYAGDPAKGQILYNIGGCISCHKPGPDQANADPALPTGGAPLKTPVGVLFPPNLTPDLDTGLGKLGETRLSQCHAARPRLASIAI